MRIAIIGGKGMLGRTLQRHFAGHEVTVADLPEWDILDGSEFSRKLGEARPELVIHCAAMTKVDECETRREVAFRINETGSENVAKACRGIGARLIAISTDYVFSGEGAPDGGWRETDETEPRTVYGASKLAGELAVLRECPGAVVMRTAWLYGSGGPSFVHTMAKLGEMEGEPVRVVDDQFGNPTSADALAGMIGFVAEHPEVSGIVHATCEGRCSWHEFAGEIFRGLGLKRGLEACTTEEFPRPAPRPRDSALAKDALKRLGCNPPGWRDALHDFLRMEWAGEEPCRSDS